MRIAVTGANGFVGAHVVRKLARQHSVLAIDNLRYGPWRFSREEQSTFASDTTDLRDRKRTNEVISAFSPDAIIHLAAIHFIPECEQLPDEAVSINTQATVNLLLACPSACRFIYTSTAAVYSPIDTAHREYEDPIGPMDVYGFTKLHGEDFVRYFAEQKKLESFIVRLFNVIGPGETNPHVLPEIVKQLKDGNRTLSLGNIHPRRDYIYVADVADGFIAAATRSLGNESRGKPIVVNLGSGKSYSVKELVERLEVILGERIEINVDPIRVRKVDRPQLLSDNSRIRSLLDWHPQYEIDEALKLIWDNPDFYNAG
jgi:UDP-glucose 4-epimerase